MSVGAASPRRIHRRGSLLGLFILFLLFAFSAKAAPSSNFTSLDLGAYGSNLFQRFSVAEDLRSHVSTISAFVRLRRGFHLGKKFFFEPAFGLLLPWRSGADGNVKVFTAHLDLPLLVPIFSFLSFRVGPGIQMMSFLSSPQSVQLNNGSSTNTSTFYTPGKFTNVFALIVEAGLVIRFSQRVALNLDVYVPDVGSSQRRRMHGAATVGVSL